MDRSARRRHARAGTPHRRLKGAAVLALLLAPLTVQGQELERAIPASEMRSGSEFVSAATRAQQDDLTVNPGMLWVEQGERLWREPAGPEARSCASCHGEAASMRGVATRYPLYDSSLQRLLNLEGRIQRCHL